MLKSEGCSELALPVTDPGIAGPVLHWPLQQKNFAMDEGELGPTTWA